MTEACSLVGFEFIRSMNANVNDIFIATECLSKQQVQTFLMPVLGMDHLTKLIQSRDDLKKFMKKFEFLSDTVEFKSIVKQAKKINATDYITDFFSTNNKIKQTLLRFLTITEEDKLFRACKSFALFRRSPWDFYKTIGHFDEYNREYRENIYVSHEDAFFCLNTPQNVANLEDGWGYIINCYIYITNKNLLDAVNKRLRAEFPEITMRVVSPNTRQRYQEHKKIEFNENGHLWLKFRGKDPSIKILIHMVNKYVFNNNIPLTCLDKLCISLGQRRVIEQDEHNVTLFLNKLLRNDCFMVLKSKDVINSNDRYVIEFDSKLAKKIVEQYSNILELVGLRCIKRFHKSFPQVDILHDYSFIREKILNAIEKLKLPPYEANIEEQQVSLLSSYKAKI